MELRIVRWLATLGFFGAVTAVMVTIAGPWGYVGGAVLFGAMMAYLWKVEQTQREESQIPRPEGLSSTPPALPPGPGHGGSWS